MSIMEIDPPDFWLVHDEETAHMPMRRVWIVAPLRGPKGERMVLARVDPPARLTMVEHDFALLVPRLAGQRLVPMSHNPLFGEICEYRARYRGQTRVTRDECGTGHAVMLFDNEGQAREVDVAMKADRALPRYVYDQWHKQRTARLGCLLGLWAAVHR